MPDFRKILTFGIAGAVGCFVAALAGEIWLSVTRGTVSPVGSQQEICLLLDCSSSMADGKLEEMQQAATKFISRRAPNGDSLSVVGFNIEGFVASHATTDANALKTAVNGLQLGPATNMSDGISTALHELSGERAKRYIIIFTDGMPTNPPEDTVAVARNCRSRGVELHAVATGDADTQYLAELTGNPRLVYSARQGQFDAAFREVERAINAQLLESSPSGSNFFLVFLQTGGWSGLLAAGTSVALAIGQNYYLKRPLVHPTQAAIAFGGGLAAGGVAGLMTQALFNGVYGAPTPVVEMARLLCWTILGALLGLGVSLFVPNLRKSRGALGGAAGGLLGGLCFLIFLFVGVDFLGRILGAVAVGFCIGLMIAVMEAASRQLWLTVEYGPREKRQVTLGAAMVSVGSARNECTVLVQGVAPIALKYVLCDGHVQVEEVATAQKKLVSIGDTRRIGNVTLRVEGVAAGGVTSSSAPGPPKRDTTAPSSAPSQSSPSPKSVATTALPVFFFLRIGGRSVSLAEGKSLKGRDFGIEADPEERIAEVVRNPADPAILGLKNLTAETWKAQTPSGEQREIVQGKSIKLAKGTKVTIKGMSGLVE